MSARRRMRSSCSAVALTNPDASGMDSSGRSHTPCWIKKIEIGSVVVSVVVIEHPPTVFPTRLGRLPEGSGEGRHDVRGDPHAWEDGLVRPLELIEGQREMVAVHLLPAR